MTPNAEAEPEVGGEMADLEANGKQAALPAGRRQRGRRERTVTLDDVARLVGVSPSTVSRVVTNSIPVSAELRAQIEAAIAELGYTPNLAARSLAARRSDTVGVVVSGAANDWLLDPFITHLLFGIAEGLAATNTQLALIMAPVQRKDAPLQWYLRHGYVDGFILISSYQGDPLPQQLVGRGIPMVMSGRPPQEVDVGYVDVDHRSGAHMAVSHLLAGGRRCIAAIHGTLTMPSSLDKRAGHHDALAEAGLAPNPDLEAVGNYSPTVAGDAMQALLQRHPDIDAVFAASDTMAAAALGVILKSGRRVPDDVAVVGYDGTPVALTTRPMLTTIRQPIEAMGRKLAAVLLASIAAPDQPPQHVVFPTELIVRESSGARSAAPTCDHNQETLL